MKQKSQGNQSRVPPDVRARIRRIPLHALGRLAWRVGHYRHQQPRRAARPSQDPRLAGLRRNGNASGVYSAVQLPKDRPSVATPSATARREGAVSDRESETPGNHAERFWKRAGCWAPNPKEIYDGSTNLEETVPSYCSRIKVRSAIPAPERRQKLLTPSPRFRWALSFQGISHGAGKVLAALADHADQRKLTCFPAISTLMRETQVSERGVRYALRKLEAAGAILTERSRGRSSSLYRLMIPLNPADSAPSNRGVSPPSNPARIARSTRQGLPPSTGQGLPP